MDAVVLDFIQDLDEADTADSVGRLFQVLIEDFGFSYFCIGAFTPTPNERGRVWTTSLGHPWLKHWVESERISVDPVIWRLKRNGNPLRWSALQKEHPDTPHIEVLDEASEFGIHDGWAMAFSFGRGRLPKVAIGLGTSKYDLDPDAQMPLHLASISCAMKLAQFGCHRESPRDLLSDRERQCLCWVASGKTDCDISEIVGISQQTVHKHVSNALKKLNAATRAQAVALALTSRLIAL